MICVSAEWSTAEASWVAAVATWVVALTGVFALRYARRQLSQSREDAKIQHFLKLVEQFDTEPLTSVRKSLAQKRLKNVAEPPEMDTILNFFETIGLLVKRGYLDTHDIWDSFSEWMFNVYADARESIEEEQKEDASYYCDFSALIEKLRVIEANEGCTAYPPSSEDIEEFWKYELNVIPGKATVKHRKRTAPQKGDSQTGRSK